MGEEQYNMENRLANGDKPKSKKKISPYENIVDPGFRCCYCFHPNTGFTLLGLWTILGFLGYIANIVLFVLLSTGTLDEEKRRWTPNL